MKDAQHDLRDLRTFARPAPHTARRVVCRRLRGRAALARARGQARALPLENLGLEHLDIVVPDAAESARFYKRVFSSPLHEQDFRGGKRYFVLLGICLPTGKSATSPSARPTAGRSPWATTARSPRRRTLPAIGKELAAAGYPEPGGGFGMIPDPDGLELQLFEPPAGLVAAAVPSTLEVARRRVARSARARARAARRERPRACAALLPLRVRRRPRNTRRRRTRARVVPPRAQYADRDRAGRPRRDCHTSCASASR